MSGTQSIDSAARDIKQDPSPARAVGKQGITSIRKIRACEKGIDFAMRFSFCETKLWRPGKEMDRSANRIRSILSAVWPSQNFHDFRIARISQIEKRIDATAHRRGRIAHAIDIHGHFISSQTTHKDSRNRRAGSLKTQANFFVCHLSEHGRGALLNCAFGNNVDSL